MHNAQGMMVDEETIPTHEYIVNKLNDYGLAYVHLTEPFTDVTEVPFAVTEIAKHFRPLYKGTLIINKSFNKESGIKVIEDGYADLVAYGVPFLANPDLVARFQKDAELNTPDQSTFYTATEKGYIDYPEMVG
jgi:N-ethylmaleimide reductase